MTSDAPLYKRDPEAWAAHLAEGNAEQARKRVGADVVLRDQHGRLLLVDPKNKPDWDLPGGMAETTGHVVTPSRLAEFRFCTVEEASRMLRPYVWRRVEAALEALKTGQARYLQDGY